MKEQNLINNIKEFDCHLIEVTLNINKFNQDKMFKFLK
jgi:hypothetical protein